MSYHNSNFNHQQAIDSISDQILNKPDQIIHSFKDLLAKLINQIMISERNLFLNHHPDSKANGFYNRSLNSGSFHLDLDVPRDRSGSFRPHILPPLFQRHNSDYSDLLLSLIINGYSESQIASTLNHLGLPYSDKEIALIKDDLLTQLRDFKSRPIPDKLFSLFIDGYHCQVKDDSKIKDACTYLVLGVDLNGKKDVFGLYTFFGSESKGNWIKIFNDLISRGLKKVPLIISDDFSGLDNAIQALFPLSDHQLCFVHFQRSVFRNMDRKDAHSFIKALKSLRFSKNSQQALSDFHSICQKFHHLYPSFIQYSQKKAKHFFAFLDYPEDIRKHIYSTNAVESINAKIEKSRLNSGGFFHSSANLELNFFLSYKKLKTNKWKLPIPSFKANLYDINQIFNLKFNSQTQDS